MSLPIVGQPQLPAYRGSAFLAKGFRPFFLIAAVFAAIDMPLWLLHVAGGAMPSAYFEPASWHAHELVFGFAGAVIAGFLLTAVGNWTGRETLIGRPLLALVSLWVAARLVMFIPAPPWLVAVVDLAFLPALALAIGRSIIATKNRRNYVMLVVLGLLWLTNLLMHLDTFGHRVIDRRQAVLSAVDVTMVLIAFIAARIVPTFTRNATGVTSIRNMLALDRLSLGALIAVVVVDIAWPESIAAGVCAAIAAVALGLRSATWGAMSSLRVPLLWVLHAGHSFLVIGFALRAIACLTAAVPNVAATHGLTVGAIGLMTLGMMARVALGHTGRKLVGPAGTVTAFALMLFAATVRTFGTLWSETTEASLYLAGGAWSAAFAIYVIRYGRILVASRADGKPG